LAVEHRLIIFNAGDRISLTDKIEGTVAQMNWRSIRILTEGDDVAIVPNCMVAKADIVTVAFRRASLIH
jgi:small-conductance mechanosensitive channel